MPRDSHQPISEPASTYVKMVESFQCGQPHFLMDVLRKDPITPDQVIDQAENLLDVAIVYR